jgi:hypothetical protein
MSISTLAIVNSLNRLPESNSPTNFLYSIGSSVEISELAIKSICIPNTSYNINDTNNQLTFIQNGNPRTIIIAVGQYNTNSLITAITALIKATDAGFSITQDPLTLKLTYNFTSPTQIYISPRHTLPIYFGFNLYLNQNVITYPTIATNVIVAPTLPNLTGIKNYYVASRTLAMGSNCLLYNGVKNLAIIATVPNSAPFGSVNYYTPPDILLDTKQYSSKQNIQTFDIVILDSNFDIVDLNGADVEFVFKLYYNKRVE